MKKISLVKLKSNRRGRIVEILGGSGLEAKLEGMGLYAGKEIAKVSHIGLRGPVVIKVGRSILALGHGVAAKVIVNEE